MSQSLPTELDTLIYRGLLLPGAEDDPRAFAGELAEYAARGEITLQQAAALCDIVGLGSADLAVAYERARGAIN